MQGEFGSAAAAYVKVMEAAQQAPDSAKLAVFSSLQRLAEIAVLTGEWDRAMERLKFVGVGFAEAGNNYMADYVSTQIAAVENARGMSRVTAQVLEQMAGQPHRRWDSTASHLPVWEKEWVWPDVSEPDRAVFFTRYYLEAGQVEAYRGQFERATALLRRGLDWIPIDRTAAAAGVPLCLGLTSAQLQQGDVRTAALYLEMVPADLDEQRQPAYLVFRLELEARLGLLTGDLASAKSSLERALQLCQRTVSNAAWSNAALNLAQVLVFLNQTARARQLCQDALESARTMNDTATQVRAAHVLSLTDERTQSLVGAVSLAPSVTEMWLGRNKPPAPDRAATRELTPFEIEECPDYLTLFDERVLGFYWYLSRANLDGARRYLDELNGVFLESKSPTDSLLINVRIHALYCMLAYYEGNYAEALVGLCALCPYLREMGLKPDLWQVLRFLEWTLIRLGRTSEADAVSQDAAKVLEAITQSLSGADLALFLLNKWTVADLYMAAEIEVLTQTKRKLMQTGWRSLLLRPWYRFVITRRLAKLLDYADQYKTAIFDHSAGEEPRVVQGAERTSFLRLLRHPRSRATAAWIVLPDMTLIARAGWLSLDFGVSAVSKIQVREWVRQWHEAIRDEESGKARLAMRQLAASLQIDELMQTLPRRVRTIDFVPDDVLHGIPFAALEYGAAESDYTDTGQYVGATHAVTVQFKWTLPKCKTAAHGTGVIVGIPYGAGIWNPLPSAAAEAREIANVLQARQISVSSPSNRTEIIQHLPQARFFHIACHGTFQPDRPDESGLVVISELREIELLTVRDIGRLDLHNMQQAVLSGCWAADNFIFPGRWIISLPSALCQAGAGTVIASLWPVDDAIAAKLFALVYRNDDGSPPEELLHRVRQSCIDGSFRSDDTLLEDPFFWAAVQVYRGYK